MDLTQYSVFLHLPAVLWTEIIIAWNASNHQLVKPMPGTGEGHVIMKISFCAVPIYFVTYAGSLGCLMCPIAVTVFDVRLVVASMLGR